MDQRSRYFAQARNFEEVRGFATAGGQDYATLYAGNTSDSWIKNSEFAQLVTSDTRVRSAMGFEKIDTFDATVAVKVATLATLDHTSPSIASADSSFDTYTANPVVAAAEERAAALLASSQPMRLPEPAIFPAVSKKLERETLGNIFASDEGYLNPPRV